MSQRPAAGLQVVLGWVQQHIGAFGGDPRRVTVAGRSGQLMRCWAAFVQAGRPDAPGLPQWPAHQPGSAPFRRALPDDPVTAWDTARMHRLFQAGAPQGCAR